jgi:hypothetical protein
MASHGAADISQATPVQAAPDADPVGQLLAAGKCKQAVELAKERHKAARTPESERQLVGAYLGRIEQFQSKGMTEDADTVIALVQQRFPAYQAQLTTLKIRAAAGSGRIDELVAPLARADTPASVRTAIEAALRQDGVDLPALAGCGALPADHPLRVAAAAIHRAFEAVTTGPVDEAALALPEVSFRSPLAGWKMLVRAIGAFYRQDDDACRRAAEAIPADSAAHRLVPTLLGMLDKRPPKTGAAGALAGRVASDDGALRESLEALESALQRTDSRRLIGSIRTAVRLCSAAHPDQYDRLRQHIAVACAVEQVPPDILQQVLPAPRADAYFWRLMAKGTEADGVPDLAAIYWQRFLAHALAEGTVSPCSPEAAVVYRHAATLLAKFEPFELGTLGGRGGLMSLVEPYYQDQPKEIAALAPKSEAAFRSVAISPGALFRLSVNCEPDLATYRLWWAWSGAAGLPDKEREDIAKAWHESRPTDVEPLLHLGALAEGRNALKMALKHMAAAEAIDPMNPDVRRARLRLTVATAIRHLRDKKPHLMEQDLAALDPLPGMRDGDRAALLAALRCAWLTLSPSADNAAAEEQAVAEVVQRVGPEAAQAMLDSLVELAKLPRKQEWPGLPLATLDDARAVARADARLITLAADVGLGLMRPIRWDNLIDEVLRERPCPLTVSEMLAIGGAAAARGDAQKAYLASAAGLAVEAGATAGRGNDARFLMLRAASLLAPYGRARGSQCLRAALELARQSHEAGLIDMVLSAIDRHAQARRALADSRNGEGIGDAALANVLEQERAAARFPRSQAEADKHLVLLDRRPMMSSPFEMFEPFDDDDDDDDDDDYGYDDEAGDDGGFDPQDVEELARSLPPEVAKPLGEIMRKLGRFPTMSEVQRMNPALLNKMLDAFVNGALGGKPPSPKGKNKRRR